jgi:hypothetical protein
MLCEENRMDNAFFLSLMGNTFHNLSASFGDDYDRVIEMLKKSLVFRELAAQFDATHNCMTAYTLNRLAAVYYRTNNIEMFILTFEKSLAAMEIFCSIRHSTEIILFQDECLSALIYLVNIFILLRIEEKLPEYQRRLENLLLPFERFVLSFHKSKIFEIAYSYYHFLRVFSDNKGILYFKEALNYNSPKQKIYGGLAFNLSLLGAEAMRNDKEVTCGLFREALSYFNRMSILDEVEQGMKNKIIEYLRIDCN